MSSGMGSNYVPNPSFISKLVLKFFPKKKPKHKCTKCGSTRTVYGWNWIRGWNNLCSQAYGDRGYRCSEWGCGNIDWDKSHEDHLKTLPEWCTPYSNSKETE